MEFISAVIMIYFILKNYFILFFLYWKLTLKSRKQKFDPKVPGQIFWKSQSNLSDKLSYAIYMLNTFNKYKGGLFVERL